VSCAKSEAQTKHWRALSHKEKVFTHGKDSQEEESLFPFLFLCSPVCHLRLKGAASIISSFDEKMKMMANRLD